MAASAGMKAGSVPSGVAVGVGVRVGSADGLVEPVGVGVTERAGVAVTVGLGLGRFALAVVQPADSTADAVINPRSANGGRWSLPGMPVRRPRRLSHAAAQDAMLRSQPMPYAHSETPDSIRAALGAVIRRRREDAERSLSALAQAADMSTAYLSEVERGLKDISTDKLVAIAGALDLAVAELYLEVAQRLGSREAMQQRRSWPEDPRMQLRIAAASLRPNALRSVADFSLYLASTQSMPQRRRIGFTVDR
ncbi:MAG: helix-turn-helix transcriptional regulator [Chloroflexi bacterium]|nr:MAG: helix-turn-helix transcriptional regulator [Chloroflexota bacterium]